MSIKGYKGALCERGKFVLADEAFDYAAKRCGITLTDPAAPNADEFKEMLVEWFFSDNWLVMKDDEEEYDDE